MAAAAGSGWEDAGGGVYTSSSGGQARVQASTQGASGGRAQPAGDQAAPDQAGTGHDPWAKYNLATDPATGDQQLCWTPNQGLSSVDAGTVQVCHDATTPDLPDSPAATDPALLAAQAVAQLTVPAPQISISPHPSDNKWNQLAVGLPIWAWTEDPGPITTSISQQGIDIQLQANRGSVTFDWGDGTTSVCHLMRPRPATMDPLTPSPDCGHTYLRKGDYTITATAGWAVNWQALGQTGALPLNSTATIQVPIREFRAVVVG
ncbi:MAG: hypothetical protein WBL05_12060 [Brooklawnia sp.]|uniref:hypothetical protein n=1 Tax=Brooklawnia sp. TaxID=2699740 RepID=UPI003C763283